MARARARSGRKRKSRTSWLAAAFLELASLAGILAVARPNLLAEFQGLDGQKSVSSSQDAAAPVPVQALESEGLGRASSVSNTESSINLYSERYGANSTAMNPVALDAGNSTLSREDVRALHVLPPDAYAHSDVGSTNWQSGRARPLLSNSAPTSHFHANRGVIRRRIWPPPVSKAPAFHW